jgi:uncharacterized protein (DUF427 family)
MLSERLRIHAAEGIWVVRAGGAVIGETCRALELTEGAYPPVIYFPREDLGMAFFERSSTTVVSPDKGLASYYDILVPAGAIRDAAWSYEAPLPAAERIAGHLAFASDKVTIEQV